MEGLQHIASTVDFIDLSRVAIHGSSYGESYFNWIAHSIALLSFSKFIILRC